MMHLMKGSFQNYSQLSFINTLPHAHGFKSCAILIYDKKLEKYFSDWIKSFKFRIAVQSGEKLKSLSSFEKIASKLQKFSQKFPKSEIEVISFGGGSVGDLCGFLAATYKRGVGLVHIPTTWLAAMDSAHGGKNALNLNSAKNQIGCFYAASQVYLVKNVLSQQPQKLVADAYGEAAKITLLDKKADAALKKTQSLWLALPELIAAKMRIVNRDPLETKKIRQALNLGHTMGHVLESSAKLSHGKAVGQGLIFSLELSHSLGILKQNTKSQLIQELQQLFNIKSEKVLLKKDEINKYLAQDKKNDKSSHITFVLLKDRAQPVLKNIKLEQVHATLRALRWLK